MIHDPMMATTMIAAVFLPLIAMFAVSLAQLAREVRAKSSFHVEQRGR